MELTISTPALLFSTISLLMLAYTNRFLAIANLIRNLSTKFRESHNQLLALQITSLRKRIRLIRNMQFFAVFSLLCSMVCMLCIFLELQAVAKLIFILALSLQVVSVCISLAEIFLSVDALEVELKDMEADL